jgi:hypothetical protein
MWAPPSESAMSPGVWRRLTACGDAFGMTSMWSGADFTNYNLATAAFMSTNCPTMKPFYIARRDETGGNTANPNPPRIVLATYLNSCGCRKADNSWIDWPYAVGVDPLNPDSNSN